MNTIYLLRGNTQSDFTAMVKYLKNEGYEFPDSKSDTSYQGFRNLLGKRVVILLEGRQNYITGKKEITVTYLAKLNRLNNLIDKETYSMKDVQTVIPVEFYEGVIK